MGAFGGSLRFDGADVAQPWLAALGRRLARLGPDGEAIARDGTVGFVFRAFPNDVTESAAPLWTLPEGMILAFDGRLDNGPDLRDALGISGAEEHLDVRIVTAGLRRDGPAFVGKLIGDFALACWDPLTHVLTLGRDAAGTRTLYYCLSSKAFCFATDLGSLVSAADVDRALDEDYIAGHLACGVEPQQTIYRQVRAVRPAEAVTVSDTGRVEQRLTWGLPSESTRLAYRHDGEYEEHFLSLFRDAVRVRLRANRPVVAELSGGLDSSSIFCVAHQLLQTGAAPAPSLMSVSIVPSQERAFDDARYREIVERQCEREAFHVPDRETARFERSRNAHDLHLLSALLINGTWDTALSARMRMLGARVVLSGTGGDEMFCGGNLPLPSLGDLCHQARFRELHRELARWSFAIREPYIHLLWKTVTTTWLNRTQPLGAPRWRPPTWMAPRLAERARAIRDARDRRWREYRLPSDRDHARSYDGAISSIAGGYRQEFDARHVTYPCLHRPLVAFLYAVPFSQKLRRGESRSLQRRALRGILPTAIHLRRGKGNPQDAFLRGLRENDAFLRGLLTDSVAAQLGYVDMAAIAAMLRRTKEESPRDDFVPLAPFVLETWLRTHLDGRSSNLP
jgi:asparagine synthase (glutamine-hydrolysing)